jgi:ribosomal protein S18 acetylase RimI-like enzyme
MSMRFALWSNPVIVPKIRELRIEAPLSEGEACHVTNGLKMDIQRILPTQLYISQKKYRYWQDQYERHGFEACEPVPVKTIGRDTFFTDGHTRALVLWKLGHREIAVQPDNDDLNWIMYLKNLKWCRDQNIVSIDDLENRIVSAGVYEEKWLNRCAEEQARIEGDPLCDLVIGFQKDPVRKSEICEEILRSLPRWFGIEEAITNYVSTVRDLLFITVNLYGKTVGFCAVKVHYGINAELYVLGVFEAFHRTGIGKRMMVYLEDYCRANDIKFLTVKTLSERHPDVHYRKTRRFYEHCGFMPLEVFDTLWGPENPCLYMLKSLS